MPRDSELLTQMSTNPWFCGLSLADRESLLTDARRRRVGPGGFVFRLDDAPDGFYALVSGTLRVSTLREDGKEAILCMLEPSAWFGEASMVDGMPRSHDVTAVGAADLLVVDARTFNELMLHDGFARSISLLMARHIRYIYGTMKDATLRSTGARIARRLQRLARGDAAMAPSERHVITITHDTLAMMLGITRQTLALELKSMVSRGAIALGYGRIDILSMDMLRDIESGADLGDSNS